MSATLARARSLACGVLYVEQFATTDEMVDVDIDNDTLVVAERGNGVRFFACPTDVLPPHVVFGDSFEPAP